MRDDPATEPIRALVVDDQPLQRTGNALILDAVPDIEVVGEAGTGEEAITLTRRLSPDVVLMDVRMPGMDGIEATRAILREHPNTRVIVLTTFDLDEYAFGSLRAGASAFLLKSAKPEALVDAVRTVHAGTAVVDPRLTRQLIDHYLGTEAQAGSSPDRAHLVDALTRRERDIFDAIARGLDNGEIAAALHLAPSTVKSYVNVVFAKLGVRDRVHAVLLAHGLPAGDTPRS